MGVLISADFINSYFRIACGVHYGRYRGQCIGRLKSVRKGPTYVFQLTDGTRVTRKRQGVWGPSSQEDWDSEIAKAKRYREEAEAWNEAYMRLKGPALESQAVIEDQLAAQLGQDTKAHTSVGYAFVEENANPDDVEISFTLPHKVALEMVLAWRRK